MNQHFFDKNVSEAYNIDCMAYMRSVPDKFFDLAIVDPPYGDCHGNADRKLNGERLRRYAAPGMKPGSWDTAPTSEYFSELFRVSRNQIIWGGNYFNLPPTRCFIVWYKTSISEEFSFAQAEYAWSSFDTPAKVYEARPMSNKGDRIHAYQKPVGLYGFLLKHFAHTGDKILDTHMGSQSSRIAAYKAGFDYWGCEIDEFFYRTGCARFESECHHTKKMKGHTITELTLF